MSFGFRGCLYCGGRIDIELRRDIIRKKFCSRACIQRYRWKTDPTRREMFLRAQLLSMTPEANAKKGRKGKDHSKYKPDRSQVKFRLRPETSEFKKAVFSRDGYKCVWCGATEKLVADHIKPYATYPTLRYNPANGRTLCEPCHRKTDTFGGRTRKPKQGASYPGHVAGAIREDGSPPQGGQDH